jgi:HlyD family secretion protein
MANPGQSRTFRAVSWIAALLLVVFGFLLLRNLTRETVEVRVAHASFQTLSSTVSTNGKVEPVSEYPANAPFSGVLQKIYVHVGDPVERGTLLLQMNDADAKARIATAEAAVTGSRLGLRDVTAGGSFDDLNRFQSELAGARADESKARTTLQTDQQLLAKGAVSAGEVTAAQQNLAQAEAALQSAEARVNHRFNADDRANAQAHVADAEAALTAARAAEANVDIRSPISGTVYSLPFSQYDFVQSGQDIMDIADLKRLQVRAYFDEPDIGKLAIGQPVKIVWDAKPGEEWHGHIARVPTTIMTSGTRNVGECLITVDDAKGDLIPNVDVTITVTESQRTSVLSVPREALHTDGGKNFVYRIVDGRLAVTPVVTGLVNTTAAEIVSGLKANDVVVLRPVTVSAELSNGLEVKPIE